MRPINRNLAANAIQFSATAVAGFVVGPILLACLGPAAFGTWKAIQRFFEVLLSPDGGAAQALKWAIAQRSGDTDPGPRRRAIGAALRLWVSWLPLLAIAGGGLGGALPHILASPADADPALVHDAAFILAANVLLGGLLAIPHAVLIGTGHAHVATIARTATLLAANLAMVICAWLGLGLVGLALCVLAAAVLNGVFTTILAARRVDWFGLSRPEPGDMQALARQSRWMLIWTYVQRLLLASEILLLGIFAGPLAIAAYAFTAYAAQFILAASQLGTSAVTPVLGDMLGRKAHSQAGALSERLTILTLVAAIAAGCSILILNPSFVRLWVGDANFLGSGANALVVLLTLHLVLFRQQTQLREASLDMRGPALRAAACLVAGTASAITAWLLWHSVEALLLGLLIGRMAFLRPVALPASRRLCCAALLLGSFLSGRQLTLDSWTLLVLCGLPLIALVSALAALAIAPTQLLSMPRRLRLRSS